MDNLRSMTTSPHTATAIMFLGQFMDLILTTSIEPVLPEMVATLDQSSIPTFLAPLPPQNPTNKSTSPGSTLGLVRNYATFSAVGVLVSAKPVIEVISSPIIGFIIERLGFRIFMQVGYISAFISTIGLAYGDTFLILLISRLFQGLGATLWITAGFALLCSVHTDPKSRGTAMVISFSGAVTGLIVGFPFGSGLFQLAGRETVFLVIGAVLVLMLVFRMAYYPGVTFEPDEESKGCKPLTKTISDPYVVIALMQFVLMCYISAFLLTTLPLHLMKTFVIQQWQIGVIFLIPAVCQCIVQLTLMKFAYKIGWWKLCMLGQFVSAAGVIGIVFVTNEKWLVALPNSFGFIGVGVFSSSFHAMLSHLADIRIGAHYATVFSLCRCAMSLGYFLGSLISGLAVDAFGHYKTSLGTCIGEILLALTCLALRNVPARVEQITLLKSDLTPQEE